MQIRLIAFAVVVLNVSASVISAKRRIYGGVNREIQNFPWIVAILRYGTVNCGGSILSENFVLTAAHCLYADIKSVPWPFLVRYGTNRPFDINSGTVVKIINYTIHLDYGTRADGFEPINDIAVLQLENPIIFSSLAAPITLRNSPAQGWEVANVAGWGTGEHGLRSDTLKSTDVFVVDWPECQKRADYSSRLTLNQVCTIKPGKGPCSGDSGGPLIVKNLQVGIVSYGIGDCVDSYYPAVYTNVPNYKGFIQSATLNSARWSD